MDGKAAIETKAARKGAGLGTAGVTATAIALFAVAIYFGARGAGQSPPPAAPPASATPAPATQAAAAPAAAAPAAEKHPPRRLQEANRHELETTLPKGAPVDVTANAGDAEAYKLAEEIQAFLFLKGYHVGDVTRSVSTPPAKGVGLQPLAGGHWRVIVGSADE